ncbi:MAG: TonB-dependent receptor [Deltaproteobacteria bacterium]|jgi:iron complex outermembrane receptor protein|nr:TonB-dependent receptor [Deltaproteobacteria bacterium]
MLKNILGLMFLSLLLFPFPAVAQTDEETEAAELPAIDVRGVIRREELKTTSATVLDNKDVSSRVFYEPLDMIKMSPGVSMTHYGESGVAPPFQIRGFKAGHSGDADVTMYLDGIPLHDNGHTTGYLDTGIIMPIEIESMEIIKGPSSVYYGAHAAGGSIPIQTIKGGNLTRLNLRYGSYNNMDATGLLAREDDKFSQVYAFEVFHTDGWRANSDWDKKNFSGRWSYKFTDKFMASLNVRAYQSEWDSAGYISKLLGAPPSSAVDDGSGQGNGGKRDRYDARLWANYFINDENEMSFYIYGTTLKHTRWQKSGPTLTRPIPGAGSEQYNTHKSWGTGLTYSFKGELDDREATVTVGASYSNEKEDPRRTWSLPWGTGRARGGQTSDTTFDIKNPAVMAEATYQVLKPLNIRLGARYDWLSGDFANNLTGTHLNGPTYKNFSPKAGILYTPLEWLDVYANFGRGFSMPSVNAAQFYDGNVWDLKRRDQYELGYRARVYDWMNLEMTVYRINTVNDTSFDEQTNTNMPVGKTTRQGVEAAVDVRPHKDLRFRANYAYTDARYKDRKEFNTSRGEMVNLKGHRIIEVPRHITNLELSYEPPQGFGGRVSFRWEADALLRDPGRTTVNGIPILDNGVQVGPYKRQDNGTLDMQLNYRFNDSYRIVLDVLNVLDKKYYGSQGAPDYATGDFTYSYQPPMTVYLGLEMNWDKN